MHELFDILRKIIVKKAIPIVQMFHFYGLGSLTPKIFFWEANSNAQTYNMRLWLGGTYHHTKVRPLLRKIIWNNDFTHKGNNVHIFVMHFISCCLFKIYFLQSRQKLLEESLSSIIVKSHYGWQDLKILPSQILLNALDCTRIFN